jgi:hypothetical protein
MAERAPPHRASPGKVVLDLPQHRRRLADLGFVEIGRVVDRFRVDGVSLTDVEMTLKL